jgi:hypothetical protein
MSVYNYLLVTTDIDIGLSDAKLLPSPAERSEHVPDCGYVPYTDEASLG